MILFLAALAQAVAAAEPTAVAPPCSEQGSPSTDVIVCARRADGPSPYRIRQLPPPPAGLPKAEAQIANGVSIGAETESADVGGFVSNRAMLRLKIKF
jgi:hypothetical protein